MNKNYVINNGNFTKNGNFSGYSALGERVHIFGRQMESLGWTKDKASEVKFPFYVIATIKPVGKLDDKGVAVVKDGVPVTEDRLTALSAFKTREEIKQAHADASLLDIEIVQEVQKQASSAGLTNEMLKSLASTPF